MSDWTERVGHGRRAEQVGIGGGASIAFAVAVYLATSAVNVASRYCGSPPHGNVLAYASGIAWLFASFYLLRLVATAFASRRISGVTAVMLIAAWFGVPWLAVRLFLPASCAAAH